MQVLAPCIYTRLHTHTHTMEWIERMTGGGEEKRVDPETLKCPGRTDGHVTLETPAPFSLKITICLVQVEQDLIGRRVASTSRMVTRKIAGSQHIID